MNDERTWMALVEREREARKMAESLLESKADEFIRSEGQWLEFLLEMERRLSREVQVFRDDLAEGLCQDISAARYFLSSQETVAASAIDHIQERANDMLRMVEKSPFISLHSLGDETSLDAIRTFAGRMPKIHRNAFNLMIHRIVAIWPIWEEAKKPTARMESDGKFQILKLSGKRLQPLGHRLFDALIRRPALQVGIHHPEFISESGKLTILFRI